MTTTDTTDTTDNRYLRSSAVRAVTAVVAFTASSFCWSLPANAVPVREAATPAPATAPYATPLDALGGQSFAQYLADHQAGDPRLA